MLQHVSQRTFYVLSHICHLANYLERDWNAISRALFNLPILSPRLTMPQFDFSLNIFLYRSYAVLAEWK